MIRLFVAIDVPDSARRDMTALCSGVPGAKWVLPEQMHLTLRFIGEVDGAMGRDVASALADIDSPAFRLDLAGVGSFGNGRGARVLWVGVKPCPEIMRLQAKIETTLQRIGLEPERRKFHPHITLARLNGAPEQRVAEYLRAHSAFATPPLEAESFVLYSSFLSQAGALHRVEASYPLSVPDMDADLAANEF
jgi:RNA 2',3'-cyclic 3'-phosphodiesterase